MGMLFKDANGNVIAQLLQMVATDEQVNAAFTGYLDRNGIHLAEGVDLQKMSSAITKNENSINGLMESVGGLKKVQNNVLLQYSDHFLGEFEKGLIDPETGDDKSNDSYARNVEYKKIATRNTMLIADIPESYKIAYYFYDSRKTFQGTTGWLSSKETYTISDSQVGWYVRASVQGNYIDLQAINVILAGKAVTDIINELKNGSRKTDILDEENLSAADKLELNITKASIESVYDSNCVLIPFFTDLHISCTKGRTAGETAGVAAKIKRHLTCYNIISEDYDPDVIVYGGDYLDNSSHTAKTTAVESHKAVRMLIDEAAEHAPVMIAKGNHDDNTMYTDYRNGYIDPEKMTRVLLNKDIKKTNRNPGQIERAYGYYDIPNKKTRVFVLNSIDVPTRLDEDTNKLYYNGQGTTGFSQEQLQFVADHLRFDEEGWQVIFFSHHPLITFADDDTEASGYSCSSVTGNHGGKSLIELIEAFAGNEKGTAVNVITDFESKVTYDFTENKSNTVIACICGHTHVYCHKRQNGIHYIATRAVYGHPTYSYISTSYYIVVDQKKRSLQLLANGDGEDYAYEY